VSKRRKFWGWGYEDEGPDAAHEKAIAKLLAERFACEIDEITAPPKIEEIRLRPPRIEPPPALSALCSTAPYDRAGHTYGKAFRDVVRALRRDFANAPDVVAFPASETDVVALLDWCNDAHAAAIPYGGGSSVVGGVEARMDGAYRGAVSIDLGRFDRVLEIDRTSRAARIQAGVYGPALEDQLRPQALTLRHFPQSFELSTLGGWIATRSGGHYATLYTHIDDFVEALRVVTPTGIAESRRLPGSGAGPSPDRMFIGSEGALGIITEAWMRLQDRPVYRASASVTFGDFYAAARAVRQIGQAGLYPSNLRLLDAGEALTSGAGDGGHAVLIVGFESADHELDAWTARALQCCRDHGGSVPEGAGKTRTDRDASRESAAGAWRNAFLRAPYLRDSVIAMGFVSDTFETAITWDRFEEFHRDVTAAAEEAVSRICGKGTVTCRFTHVYPDGPAPYFTVMAPARHGSQLEQWDDIKAAVSERLLALGGTITHHHAVGRDHRPWYDRQRPEAFAQALRAAKRELDPGSIMNPGVLVDP
jgi:alkyldihydroxyacetonephosphate synthase